MSDTTGGDAFERGAQLRRQVLGARHVDASGGSDPEAMTPLQRMITEFGWGTVWAREELDPRQRSLITVAMLIALNRPHELRIHVRGALRNGLTEAAVREIAVHAVAYCGFPAAIDASRVIEDVIEQVRAESDAESKAGAGTEAGEAAEAEADAEAGAEPGETAGARPGGGSAGSETPGARS